MPGTALLRGRMGAIALAALSPGSPMHCRAGCSTGAGRPPIGVIRYARAARSGPSWPWAFVTRTTHSTSSAATAAVKARDTRARPVAPETGSEADDPSLRLREYQLEAIESVMEGWRTPGVSRQLIAMATGAGKTVTFCNLIRQLGLRTLILVNRSELVAQTMAELKRVLGPGNAPGIVHARRKQPDRHVVVATIQSACQDRTLERLAAQDFQLLIIDEAHHSTATTYISVMLHCGFITQAEAVSINQANRGPPGAGLRLAAQLASPDGTERDGSASPPVTGTSDGAAVTREARATDGAGVALPTSASPDDVSRTGAIDGPSADTDTRHGSESPALSCDSREDSAAAAQDAAGPGAQVSEAGVGAADSQPGEAGRADADETTARVPSEAAWGSYIEGEGDSPPPSSTSDLAAVTAEAARASSSAAGDAAECTDTGVPPDASPEPVLLQETMRGATPGASPDPSRKKIVLGVTATPYRADSRDALSVAYHRLAYEVKVPQLIREGHLCKVRAHRVLTYTDISRVSTTGGTHAKDEDGVADFSANELSKAVNTPYRNTLVVQAYLQLGVGRKTLAFCCDIAHAEALADAFRKHGVQAASLTSQTSRAERDALLEMHKAQSIQVLTNVGILTEGYNDPSLSCLLMARPTKSTGLYTQCVGRGLRTAPGKPDCLIIDFTDRSHRLDRASDLITSEMMFQETEGVHLTGYEPPQPHERVAPEIRSLMHGGEMKLFSMSTYDWVPLANDLWLRVYDWQSKWHKRPSRGPVVWVHVMCDGHMTERRRHLLAYSLRLASGPKMPPIDSDEWQVVTSDLRTPVEPLAAMQERAAVQAAARAAAVAAVGTRRQRGAAAKLESSSDEDAGEESNDDDDDDDDEEEEEEAGGAGDDSCIDDEDPDHAQAVQALISSAMMTKVERLLQKAAVARIQGLHPAVLNLYKVDETKGVGEGASSSQRDLLVKNNHKWKLFPDDEDIPDRLTKRQASKAISLGIVYEAYLSANEVSERQGAPASLQPLLTHVWH